MLTVQAVVESLQELGVERGDTVLVHSSFKSLGPVQGGAKTVVMGFLKCLGVQGTLIFPTLCQKDWENVYKNWHMDAESDVGYLTNYFRKLPGVLRSNQATHSVAAQGFYAADLTRTHGENGLRYGIFGDTPFAADSPWEKMYKLNTKMVFVGVSIRSCTFRHFAEYCFMEECLKKARNRTEYEQLKGQVWHYDRWNDRGVWPHVNSEYVLEILEREGKVARGHCGKAGLLMVSAGDFVNVSLRLLRMPDLNVYAGDRESKDWISTQLWLKTISEMHG